MKKTIVLFSLSFVLFVQLVAASPEPSGYSYLNKPLPEKRFKLFYRYYQRYLYTDNAGKVHVLTTPRLEAVGKDAAPGAIGTVKGNVTAVDPVIANVVEEYEEEITRPTNTNYSDRLKGAPRFETVKVTQTRTYPCRLAGTAKVLAVGMHWTGPVLVGSPWYNDKTRQTVPSYTALTPITETAFKTYLDAGNKLYYFKKKYTPAKYKDCKACKGMGVVPIKPHSLTMKKCPACNGKRKTEISPAKTEYLRLPLER